MIRKAPGAAALVVEVEALDEWRIKGAGCWISHYTHASRPLAE